MKNTFDSKDNCSPIRDELLELYLRKRREIKLYDRVLLKDGNEASIVEIFEGGKFFIADIDRPDGTYTEEISFEEIERKISN